MGNYRIIIEGVGPHHNPALPNGMPYPFDAEKMVMALIEQMRPSGHNISVAEFQLIDPPSSLTPNAVRKTEDLLQKLSVPKLFRAMDIPGVTHIGQVGPEGKIIPPHSDHVR